MQWLEVAIMVKESGSDIMAEVLREKGAVGVSIESAEKTIFDEGSNWPQDEDIYFLDPNEYMYVKAYYKYDEETYKEIVDYIKQRVSDITLMNLESINLGECTVVYNVANDEDWANDWKKFFVPFHITKNIVVKPSWENYESKDSEIVIEIDPGLAFGTGMHETTKMCMELTEQYVKEGMSVADVGCGTGILSILAAKLGAKNVKAIDFDPICVAVTKQNAISNNVQEQLDVISGNLVDELKEKVDVVIANIVADPIIEIIGVLDRVLKPQGYFIASGIIDTRLPDVLNALKKIGIEPIEIKKDKVWIALVCKM